MSNRRPPVCGFTLDEVTCRKRGDHMCRPRADKVAAFFAEAPDLARRVLGTVHWDADEGCYVRTSTDV